MQKKLSYKIEKQHMSKLPIQAVELSILSRGNFVFVIFKSFLS